MAPLVDGEAFVPNRRDGAEPALCFSDGVAGLPARRDQFLREHLYVEPQFIVDLGAEVDAGRANVPAP